MSFRLDPAVWQRLPGMRIVVVAARGVDNATPRPAVEGELSAVESALRAGWEHPNPQSEPRIALWRDAFKALGISTKKHASSVEALVRRVLGGRDLPRISPLVDLYNAVSLRHRVPAGGWDLGDLQGDLRLGFTAGGEPFHELGGDATDLVEAGELAYRDDDEVVTRHFVWRQAERGKVTPATRDVFLLSEILGGIGDEVAAAVRADLVEGLRRHFGIAATSAILAAPASVWELVDLDDSLTVDSVTHNLWS